VRVLGRLIRRAKAVLGPTADLGKRAFQTHRQDAEISDALGYPAFKAFWLIRSSGMQHLFPRLS
jgi:hypothetical protein